jgi:hypothetical protein
VDVHGFMQAKFVEKIGNSMLLPFNTGVSCTVSYRLGTSGKYPHDNGNVWDSQLRWIMEHEQLDMLPPGKRLQNYEKIQHFKAG